MKVLFLSLNNLWTPHFETELELMSDHIEKGDKVYVLTCNRKLKYCSSITEIDYKKRRIECLRCKARFWNGLKLIGISSRKVGFINNKISKKIIGLLPDKFDNLDELKNFNLFDVDFGAAVASSLISELRDHQFDTLAHQKKVFCALYSSVLIYESVYRALKKINPDIFYIFNGRFIDSKPAVRAAQQLVVNFYLHDRGGDVNKYFISKNCFIHDLSRNKTEIGVVWNSTIASTKIKGEISKKWFIDRRFGVDQGWLSFSKKQKRRLLPLSFDSSKKNIALFNSSSDEYESFPEWRMNIYKNEFDTYIKILDEFKKRKEFKFYLRVHPNLKNLDNSQLKDLRKLDLLGFENLEIIWPSEKVDTYALLEACEKVVVFCSTVGVEACFWGKPSILLGRSLYEDLDCCYIPKDHGNVVKMLSSMLVPKNKEGALKYGYWQAVRGINFKKFKATGFFSGTFAGSKISADFGWREIMQLAFFDKRYAYFKLRKKISQFKNNIKKLCL